MKGGVALLQKSSIQLRHSGMRGHLKNAHVQQICCKYVNKLVFAPLIAAYIFI